MKIELLLRLGSKSYPIIFLESWEELSNLAQFRDARHAVVIDSAFACAWPEVAGVLADGLPLLSPASGETTKSLQHYGEVLEFLARNHIDRQEVLWVIGGGVTGDLGGFAAATYLRGISYIHVPTTLLAMVDSSIGGKTGINLTAGKNLAGAFHQPKMVVICPDFLRTLPEREFAAGMAEVLKYGLLADAEFFRTLERTALNPSHPQLPEVIRRSCEIKAAIVEADQHETASEGGRALLNLGHTFGHAIEKVAGYGTYLHGEAVAIGLAGAARLSCRLGQLTAAEVERVERALTLHALPSRLRAPLPLAELMETMAHDKKNSSGRLRFIVLKRLGEAATRSGIDGPLVHAVWRELGAAG